MNISIIIGFTFLITVYLLFERVHDSYMYQLVFLIFIVSSLYILSLFLEYPKILIIFPMLMSLTFFIMIFLSQLLFEKDNFPRIKRKFIGITFLSLLPIIIILSGSDGFWNIDFNIFQALALNFEASNLRDVFIKSNLETGFYIIITSVVVLLFSYQVVLKKEK